MELAMGFSGQSTRLSHLGERASVWLKGRGVTTRTLALQARMDKRDAQRVMDGSCGPRAFDALARTYGWPFVEGVMTAVVGADPVTALEMEIEREKAEIGAREARLQRMRDARRAVAASPVRLVSEEGRSWTAPNRKRPGGMGEEGDR